MLSIVAGLVACGTKDPPPTPDTAAAAPTTVPAATGPSLTTAQASKLARILLKNHEAGGADVDASVTFGSAAVFHLKGTVDWTRGIGRVVMTTTRSDNVEVPEQTIAWGGSSIYLSVPGLSEALAAEGHPGISYLERPVSVKTNPLDQVITLIGSFSSARADNPLLLRQGDTSFEGTGRIGELDVERLRYGRSTYSVAEDGYAYRLETTFVSIQGPIVVNLAHHGATALAPPEPTATLPLQDYSELYDSLISPK